MNILVIHCSHTCWSHLNYDCVLTSLQADLRVRCWVWGASTLWWSGLAGAGQYCKGSPLFLQTHRGSRLWWSLPENGDVCCLNTWLHIRDGLTSLNVTQLLLPVRRSCWVSSLCSWAGSTACTERYKHGRRCRCFHQMESQCHRTQAGCCRVKQLKEREGRRHNQSPLLQFNILGTKAHSSLHTTTNILLMRIEKTIKIHSRCSCGHLFRS